MSLQQTQFELSFVFCNVTQARKQLINQSNSQDTYKM